MKRKQPQERQVRFSRVVMDSIWKVFGQRNEFQNKKKKKPDWALGAKEGEGGAKAPSEGTPSEVEGGEPTEAAA